jgi:hypothetical protein
MRKVLALLLCFAVLELQCFALSGGPDYDTTSSSMVGTYSGALVPTDTLAFGIDPLLAFARANALGLFTFGQPDTGLGSGAFILFAEGQISTDGQITVLGDPKDSTFYGILEVTTETGGAAGRMDAEFDQNTQFGTARLKGDAFLTFDQGVDAISGELIVTNVIQFEVDGYRQSTVTTVESVIGG